MAAEDWIDLSDYCDDEYWLNFDEAFEEEPQPQYTDKFTFNGERKRTRFQRTIRRWNIKNRGKDR